MPSDEIENLAPAKREAAAIFCASAQPIELNDATLYLEQQKFDFESNRIQLILAFILLNVIGFLNYAQYFGVVLQEPVMGSITRSNLIFPWAITTLTFTSKFLHHFFNINSAGPQPGDVVLLSLSSFFVALISLELTGLNGNRLKTTSGIWAGLLFVLIPTHANATVTYIGHIDILGTTLYLASVAFFLRYQLLKENMYMIISGIAGLLCLSLQTTCWSLVIVILTAHLLVHPVNPNRPFDPSTSSLAKPCVVSFNWRAILFLSIWLAISLLTTDTKFSLDYLGISSLSLVFSAPLCLLIANIVLPGFYTCNKRETRALAALGCAILSVIVVFWSIALKTNFNLMTTLPGAQRAEP